MDERRATARFRITVLHHHRAGRMRFLRASELVFASGGPRAILAWVDVGGVRTPLYLCELDPAKLKPLRGARNTYLYEVETVDPRFLDARDIDAARA